MGIFREEGGWGAGGLFQRKGRVRDPLLVGSYVGSAPVRNRELPTFSVFVFVRGPNDEEAPPTQPHPTPTQPTTKGASTVGT